MSIQARLFWSAAMAYSTLAPMNTFSWIFLAALALATATRCWLALRQIAHVRAHRDAVPAMFAGTIPLEAHQKAADYTGAKGRLGMVDLAVDTVVILSLIHISEPTR